MSAGTSLAPGQVKVPEALLSTDQLRAATDTELAHTVAAILAVQHLRALEGGDVDAMLEEAFLDGFDSRGMALDPWIEGGLLFCPGSRRDKSATSHECQFVSIDDRWVWEHGAVVRDEMRDVPGPKRHKQSITIVPVVEGAKIDAVASTSKSGAPCQMRSARSYQVRAGELVQVETRARASGGHR